MQNVKNNAQGFVCNKIKIKNICIYIDESIEKGIKNNNKIAAEAAAAMKIPVCETFITTIII